MLPSGEVSGTQYGANPSDYNTWVNNVTAGRFFQACNHSVWRNNIQLPIRSGSISTQATLGFCDTSTGKAAFVTGKPGTYNGVTVYTNDLATFAFTRYDPPATGLSTTTNLQPVTTGPLYRTGLLTAGVPTVNIDGKTRTPPVNIGAY
jgi:hypothetical protein